MISYELAQQLKDAGFPQAGRGDFLHNVEVTQRNEDGLGTHVRWDEKEDVYSPTLSELIEACGEKFTSLLNGYPNGRAIPGSTITPWEAWGEYPKYHGLGSTPEEAVANLYISLKKDASN